MTPTAILALVHRVTGISWVDMLSAHKDDGLLARYVAIVMMHEEGMKPGEIAYHTNISRSTVYWSLDRIECLLMVDKHFKQMYLTCIKAMAEMEETTCV